MAHEEALSTVSLLASGDLSSDQYKAVKVDTNARIALAGEGDKAIGVLQDKPAAIDRPGLVATAGKTKVLWGGSVTKGDRVVQNSAGKFVTVGSGDDWSLGVALTTGATDTIGTVLLQPTGPTL